MTLAEFDFCLLAANEKYAEWSKKKLDAQAAMERDDSDRNQVAYLEAYGRQQEYHHDIEVLTCHRRAAVAGRYTSGAWEWRRYIPQGRPGAPSVVQHIT